MTTTRLNEISISDAVDRLHDATAWLRAWREESEERQRREDLLVGITPMEREVINLDELAEIRAVTAALRAENDQLEAELVRRRGLRGPVD